MAKARGMSQGSSGAAAEMLARKLFAPPQVQRVERRSLLLRVFKEPLPDVVLLQAPAGHGKSVALGQIKRECEARGIRSAWLNLDTSDNVGRRHARHLQALLAQLSEKGSSAPVMPQPANHARRAPQRADWLIDTLAGLDPPIALFIDDFEVLTDRSILTFWRDFLARVPSSVRVFIASRAAPELGLARLLVAGRLLLLSADDLRFSRDEVRCFFELHQDLTMHPGEIESIFRRSDGWPAAVQLFRLGLLNPAIRGQLLGPEQAQPRELAEYLTECVLEGQPPEVQRFLLRTSLLPRLHGTLCDEVLGTADAHEMLLRLEREGLFLRVLDTTQTWYRYHPLFASLMSEKLSLTEPETAREVHNRAASWFRCQSLHDEAMQHAVAAGNFNTAIEIFRDWSSRLVAIGEMGTIGRWIDQLPADRIDADWQLTLRVVWALIFLHRPARLARHLAALDRLRETRADPSELDESTTVRAIAAMCGDRIEYAQGLMDALPRRAAPVDGFDAFVEAASENMRAYLKLFRGRVRDAHVHLARAHSFNQQADATFTRGYRACFEGAALVLGGRVTAAIDVLRAGLEEQRSVLDSTFASATIASCYVWALYEAGDLDLLQVVAAEYRDMLADTAVPDFFAVAQVCIARTHFLQRRTEEGLRAIEQAQYIAAQNRWERIVALMELEKRASAARSPESPDHRKQAWLDENLDRELLLNASPPDGWTSPANELSRSTRYLLGGRGFNVGSVDTPYREVAALVIRALENEAAGKKRAALRVTRQALTLGARTGLTRLLLDHGPKMTALLKTVLEDDPDLARSSAGRIAPALSTHDQHRTAETQAGSNQSVSDVNVFTPREREILRLLSRRLTNKEIALRTLLSENTVKFHLKNVFLKLGVGSRLDAYAAIPRLKLNEDAD